MKRFITAVLSAASVFAILLCPISSAFEYGINDDTALITGRFGFEQPVEATYAEIGKTLDAGSVILVEGSTGTVLYEDNADERRPIASITKVMTLILVMEAIERGDISLDDRVETSIHAYSMGGSQIWLEPGEIMTVDELLRAVCVASANDAAVLLGEYVGGSEAAFVGMMNDKAEQLGMKDTTFKNACGLDEDGHLSTARDVAVMSRELLRHNLIRKYVTIWTDELRGGETQLVNTNKLLKSYSGITGLKTGTTSKAGVCISASAIRNDMEIIAVVLGSSDSAGRLQAATDLLDYGFANYELAPVTVSSDRLSRVSVRLGEKQYCPLYFDVPESIVVSAGRASAVDCDVVLSETLDAPVIQGQTVGEINIMCEGEILGSYEIKAAETVEKLTVGSAFTLLARALLGIE